jgi:streptogramin lyase
MIAVVAACGSNVPGGGNNGTSPLPPVSQVATPTASSTASPAQTPSGHATATMSPSPVPTSSVGFAEYPIPSAKSSLVGLTLGPDGNVWFTEGSTLTIGFVRPSGSVREFNVSNLSQYQGENVGNIAPGEGQTLWFAYNALQEGTFYSYTYLYQISTGGNRLNSASDASCIAPNQCYGINVVEPGTSGTVLVGDVLYAPSSGGGLNSILQNVNRAGALGQLNDTPSNGISGIVVDATQASGVVWAAWQLYSFSGPPSQPAIMQISSGGSVSAYQLPGTYQPADGVTSVVGQTNADLPYNTSQAITVGPDGAPWIALNNGPGSALGRIAADGTVTLFPVSSSNVEIAGITAGSDGALWFTEAATNKIGRMTTSGTLTEYPVPTQVAGLGRIITGANNSVWFTEVWANKIGRYTY